MADGGDDYQRTFELRGHAYNAARDICRSAREAERAQLIDWLAPRAGERILDAPAGGGYLADGIRRALGGVPDGIVCQEPAENFARAIDPAFAQIRASLGDPEALDEGGFDAIASLAGLHHITDKGEVYRAWSRALRPGGRLVLADVQVGTGTASYLNGFVDRFTPGGHDGIFLEPGKLGEDLRAAGFCEVEEALIDVPWLFPDREVGGKFCRGLFDLREVEVDEVWDALARDVGVQASSDGGGVKLLWQLRYARGVTKG